METISEGHFGKKILKYLPINILCCTLIAIFLTIAGFAPKARPVSFMHNFVFSQCIGNICCILIMAVRRYLSINNRLFYLLSILGTFVIAAILGSFLASFIVGIHPLLIIQEHLFFLRAIFGTLLFGSIITYFWISRDRVIATQAMVQEEKLKRITSEKKMVETHLKLLQAQIEPHFLFNTLSNILTLLDTNPEKGKSMLSDLTRYLRTSLSKTRKEMSSVGQEMELIQDYLKIYQVRMGDRLRFNIDVPDPIKKASLPPMLIQPVVENAVKHGLEPKIEGGDIVIRAEREHETLRIEIIDTGLGFQADDGLGTGLTNIKERLESLYDKKGRLILEEHQPTGVRAVIEVPYEADESHHRR